MVFLIFADLLELAEVDFGFFELSGEALGVEAQIGEGFGHAFEGRADGEAAWNGFVSAGYGVSLDVVFENGYTVHAPGAVGQRLDEIGFDCADGLEIVGEGFYVLLVGGEILVGHHYDLAGQAVAEGVLGRSLFAFAGFGAR